MNTRSIVGLLMLGLVLPASFSACQTTFSCDEMENCRTGAAGDSGTGGVSTGSIGGTSTGGIGTGGITSACNPACSGSKPVCNESAKTCVECTADSNCSGTKSACNTTMNTCVQCVKNGNCSGTTPYCNVSSSVCVECLSATDCTDANASACVNGKCEPCSTNNDCTHIEGKRTCKTGSANDAGGASGACVECTGTQYADCAGDSGTAMVCDSLKNLCTDNAEHSADLCQPCVSDAQCKPGELCVEQKVNGKSLGYFCFWKQGDTADNAPADCTLTGRPYVSVINANSIDEQPATLCSLAATTCTAMNQYRSTSCASPTNTPDDNLCGSLPGVDSKCTAYGASQYRCTVACASDDDCPMVGASSATCSIANGTRKYCSL